MKGLEERKTSQKGKEGGEVHGIEYSRGCVVEEAIIVFELKLDCVLNMIPALMAEK